MDWKNQLTKTPYLVLFIFLGAISIGTASALVTITLAGDVIITGELTCTDCIDSSDIEDNAITPSDLSRFGLGGVQPFILANNQGSEPCVLSEVRLFAGNFVPVGWVKTEGQILSIGSFTELFSLLGTRYGGDGRSSFALPDLSDINPKSTNGKGLDYAICVIGVYPGN